MQANEALNIMENSKQFGPTNSRQQAATIIVLAMCEFTDKRTKAWRTLSHAFEYLNANAQ